MKKTNTIKLTLDSHNIPPLTDEQKLRLSALSTKTDVQIDTSDAPYNPNAVWMRAAPQLPHTKKQITLRIDSEVVDFFKDTGKRYQSRINAILRSYVEHQKSHPNS
jgi:uncharacterized protein (DUF4415 family)